MVIYLKTILYVIIISYSIIQIWIDNYFSKGFLNDELTKIVIISLVVLIVLMLKEKFFNNRLFSIFSYIIISLIVFYMNYFNSLLALIALDIMFNRSYYLGIVFSFVTIYFIFNYNLYSLFYIILFSSISGYLLNLNFIQQKHFYESIDNERKLRYELENVKIKLIQNNKEIERFTEVKERNRIAREIHDNIGHEIAGILIQLEAADKLFMKDSEKSLKIISLCISKLSSALEMIRNTVYNIKPVRELDENIFRDIIDKFNFSIINFEFDGKFIIIKPEILEVLITNLKESLTNASKYSGATNIDIKIEANKNFIRFHYKDNGKGCSHIIDGIGISGMKERVKNVSGVINIDGRDGFTIICIIPNIKTNIFQNNI
ncbi:MAG: histidine kinaselike ATPase [Haloplasmataceae bacterium]|jgi:signal transduction histidine kinase|nr:histidine kinaselike ATPase [Haloplasmataceae bacterium]